MYAKSNPLTPYIASRRSLSDIQQIIAASSIA